MPQVKSTVVRVSTSLPPNGDATSVRGLAHPSTLTFRIRAVTTALLRD
jgi:hypothetical protein